MIPAGGSGKRLRSKTKKPFVLLNGKPVLYHALKAVCSSGYVRDVIVAAEKSEIKRVRAIVNKFGFRKVRKVVAGGRTRFDSVKNCLDEIGGDTDIVLIHDAARPLVSKRIIEDSIKSAVKYGACVVAVPESDTVKFSRGTGFVEKTMPRGDVWRAQTPQVFRTALIKKAFDAPGARNGATDDSSVAEKLGIRVKILRGSYENIKITTREDVKMAEALL
jgi:2-C-methyl-D-erythritol 4-phosphate cytidylyltransferase